MIRPGRRPKYCARDHDPRFAAAVASAIQSSRLARAGALAAELVTVPAGLECCPWCGNELVEAYPVTGCVCGFVAIVADVDELSPACLQTANSAEEEM